MRAADAVGLVLPGAAAVDAGVDLALADLLLQAVPGPADLLQVPDEEAPVEADELLLLAGELSDRGQDGESGEGGEVGAPQLG